MQTSRRRAVLVAPASDERKARKALGSSADEVVLDLEDAVVVTQKDQARSRVRDLVSEFGADRPVSVRINGFDTPFATTDLRACASLGSALTSVVVPKADSPDQLAKAAEILGDSPTRLQALIETPTGVRDADAICRQPRLDAVIIGYADLAATLGRHAGLPHTVWHPIQERVLVAARSAGISAIDGPHLTIADDDTYRSAKSWVRDLGFDGTWVIHPAQIDSAQTIFTPSAEAIADAHRVLRALDEAAETGAGAAELDGRMLDEALAVSARRILQAAAAVPN